MRIRSTTVVGHEFTRSRRGYDAAEVDAVIARVAQTLRDYEDQAEDLENRIAAAETAARVARPQQTAPTTESTDAAHRHATEIVQHAEEDAVARRAEIATLLEAARSEAEDLRIETEQARADVEKDRSDIDALRDAAIADAAEIRAAAHHDAQAIRLAATKEAQDLLGVALVEAKSLRADVAADAAELRDHLVTTADAELTARREALDSRREELDSQREETDETALRTAAALASAEEERSALEARLTSLRSTVQTIEAQMKTLAGDIAERAGRIGDLINVGDGEATTTEPSHVTIDSDEPSSDADEPMTTRETLPVSALPVSGFQVPAEDAPLATADASAVFEVTEPDVDLTDLAESEDSHTYAQHDAYAEPDGSGRPPAERATIIPESITGAPAASDDHHGPYRTVYQRAGRNLRARLRQEGEDPSQRGR